VESGQLHHKKIGQGFFDGLPLPRGDISLEAECIRRKVRNGNEEGVEADEQVKMHASGQVFH